MSQPRRHLFNQQATLDKRSSALVSLFGPVPLSVRRFELDSRWQHVVGAARRLGHEDIDDEIEFFECPLRRVAAGDGMGRVARLDDQRPAARRRAPGARRQSGIHRLLIRTHE